MAAEEEDALWESETNPGGVPMRPMAPGPAHYTRLTPEPISVINGWDLNFNIGNVVKYVSRYKSKGDPIGDLEKAIMYLSFEIDRLRNIGTET